MPHASYCYNQFINRVSLLHTPAPFLLFRANCKLVHQRAKMTKRARDTRLTREQIEAGDYGEEDDNAGGGGMERATAE